MRVTVGASVTESSSVAQQDNAPTSPAAAVDHVNIDELKPVSHVDKSSTSAEDVRRETTSPLNDADPSTSDERPVKGCSLFQ